MAYSDLELLARLIQCEAGGEGDNGMRAVANVVMNRVHTADGEYARVGQGNLRNIIYQQGQFNCVAETLGGQPNAQNIYNMRPTQEAYDIAQWALDGNKLPNLGEALWFFNPFATTCRTAFPSGVGNYVIRIGDHCFYEPTEAYKDT